MKKQRWFTKFVNNLKFHFLFGMRKTEEKALKDFIMNNSTDPTPIVQSLSEYEERQEEAFWDGIPITNVYDLPYGLRDRVIAMAEQKAQELGERNEDTITFLPPPELTREEAEQEKALKNEQYLRHLEVAKRAENMYPVVVDLTLLENKETPNV